MRVKGYSYTRHGKKVAVKGYTRKGSKKSRKRSKK